MLRVLAVAAFCSIGFVAGDALLDTGGSPQDAIPLEVVGSFPRESEVSVDSYLALPQSIEVLSDTLFVADQRRSEILLYTVDGTHVGSIGSEGDGPGDYRSPQRIRVADYPSPGFWVLDNANVHKLTRGMEFQFRFRNLVAARSLAVLPDGCLVLAGRATSRRGGLTKYSPTGELMIDFSPIPRVLGKDDREIFVNGASYVAATESRVWQVYETFNLVRIHSLNGELLEEFSIDDSLLEAMDEYNKKSIYDDDLRGPIPMLWGIRASHGSMWIVASPSRSTRNPDSPRPEKFILRLSETGQVMRRYFTRTDPIITDLLIVSPESPFEAFLVSVSPPQIIHVREESVN